MTSSGLAFLWPKTQPVRFIGEPSPTPWPSSLHRRLHHSDKWHQSPITQILTPSQWRHALHLLPETCRASSRSLGNAEKRSKRGKQRGNPTVHLRQQDRATAVRAKMLQQRWRNWTFTTSRTDRVQPAWRVWAALGTRGRVKGVLLGQVAGIRPWRKEAGLIIMPRVRATRHRRQLLRQAGLVRGGGV